MAVEGGLTGQVLSLFMLLLPAMAANGAPVVLTRFLYGGDKSRLHPIDGGRTWRDGRRILGEGKTWEGFIGGVLVGTLVGLIIGLLARDVAFYAMAGLIGSTGALVGDMVGSFIKRRLGLKRGAPAPVLDQLDFYAGAVIALRVAGYDVQPVPALVLALLVIGLHVGTNALAYVLGLKEEPY